MRTKLIVLCVLLVAGLVCLSGRTVRADGLADAYFDAAALDWGGCGLDWQQALCILDARLQERSGIELQMTSASWGVAGAGFNPTLAGSAWDGYAEVPTELIADLDGHQVRWTMGLISYTPGSRPVPSCAPIAFWERIVPTGEPWNDSGSIDNFVPEGFVWTVVFVTSESLFHSPATANIAGEDYSDADTMPTFTELPAIPEPATLTLLAVGGLMMIRRKR